MLYLTPFFLAFVFSVILTWAAERVCTRFGIVSMPRKRDVHRKPVPRIGGLAFSLSFLLVSFWVFGFRNTNLELVNSRLGYIDKHLVGIWAGALIIIISMLIDDIRGLSAWKKLFFQALAVIAIIASGIGIENLSNPFGNAFDLNSVYIPIATVGGIVYHFSLWSDLLTLIWLIGMMNVINFLDGVDGLAAGTSAIAAFVIFLLSISLAVNQPATAMVAIILVGATLGFLVLNFPPAKIFMGDSGSMFLGFMLGVLAVISGGKLATAFLVLGFPIIDGLIVAGGRIMRGQNPFTTPDKTHLHHRFLKAGFSVRQSIISLYLISVAFGWVSLRSHTLSKIIAALVIILIMFGLTRVLNKMTVDKFK